MAARFTCFAPHATTSVPGATLPERKLCHRHPTHAEGWIGCAEDIVLTSLVLNEPVQNGATRQRRRDLWDHDLNPATRTDQPSARTLAT